MEKNKRMKTTQLFLIIFSVFILVFIFFSFASLDRAQAVAGHIVISEVQIAGSNSSTDEFVELYNPTGVDINLNNWELAKKTASGVESILVATMSGAIKSHGFFLITHPTDYTGSVSADLIYSTSNSISNNNSIIIYSDNGLTQVDEVGFGTAIASEGATTSNPANGKSKERKANSLSTSETMAVGGIDELAGNGEDTDNNSEDFVLRDIPQPQNSQSSIEPVAIPSDTPTPTLIEEPTETPTVIPENTLTPTPSNSPTPTIIPTVTQVPSPTGIIQRFIFPNTTVICSWNFKTFSIFGMHFEMPYIMCVREDR